MVYKKDWRKLQHQLVDSLIVECQWLSQTVQTPWTPNCENQIETYPPYFYKLYSITSYRFNLHNSNRRRAIQIESAEFLITHKIYSLLLKTRYFTEGEISQEPMSIQWVANFVLWNSLSKWNLEDLEVTEHSKQDVSSKSFSSSADDLLRCR